MRKLGERNSGGVERDIGGVEREERTDVLLTIDACSHLIKLLEADDTFQLVVQVAAI